MSLRDVLTNNFAFSRIIYFSSSVTYPENLTKSAEQMAVAAGVAPGQIMKEVSAATETYARFAKDGGENIMRAAIQAKKLGCHIITTPPSIIEKIEKFLMWTFCIFIPR